MRSSPLTPEGGKSSGVEEPRAATRPLTLRGPAGQSARAGSLARSEDPQAEFLAAVASFSSCSIADSLQNDVLQLGLEHCDPRPPTAALSSSDFLHPPTNFCGPLATSAETQEASTSFLDVNEELERE